MHKRGISLLLAFVLVLGSLPATVFASIAAFSQTSDAVHIQGTTETGIVYEVYPDHIEITDYTGSAAEVVIPVQIGGLPVTIIGDHAFSHCFDIISVKIPDSVTYIDSYAFYNCVKLSSMTIPDSVTDIGFAAFEGCTHMTNVAIGTGVTTISTDAFRNCHSLIGVTLPNSLTYISNSAFLGCSGLQSIRIPDSVTYIGTRAFAFCSNLQQILVGENNPNYCIDDRGVLFNKDKKILLQAPGGISEAYSIPDSVTILMAASFGGCSSLTSILVPDSVRTIDRDAFSDCSSLEQVTFMGDAPTFGDSVFQSVSAIAYYPADNPTWTSDVMQNYGGTITWLPFDPAPEELPDLPAPSGPQLIDGFSFAEDTYSFSNYGSLIPRGYYTTLYGEHNGKILHREHLWSGTSGLCFGMAYTNAAIYNGFPSADMFVNEGLFSDEYCSAISSIRKKSRTCIGQHQIKLQDYIKYAHIYQYSSDVRSSYNQSIDDADCLKQAVEESLESGSIDVVINLSHTSIDEQGVEKADSAHAVLAVGIDGNDILIVDSNHVYNAKTNTELNRLTFNDDGSWSYDGAWLSDGINSTNAHFGFSTDVIAPFTYLITGTHAIPDTSSCNQPASEAETDVDILIEGMNPVDSDKMLCAISGEGYQIANTDILEISAFTPTDTGSRLYWISNDTTLSVDQLPAHSEIALAGSDCLMTATVEDGGSIDMTNEGSIVLDTVSGSDCTLSLETTGTHGQDVILTVSGIASDGTVTLDQTTTGVEIEGMDNGTITLVENDEIVSEAQIPNTGADTCIGYDPEGGNEDIIVTTSHPFTDVPSGSFYEDPVLWALENGITNGATETTFNPNGQCLRAHVVTFLHRAAENPEPTTADNPFTDVKTSDFFYKPVLWAVEKGITNGVSATEFGSYAVCNRAAVVTFLWRAADSPEPESSANPFTDVKTTDFFYKPVLWAVENGITNGISATEFGPGSPCNRAQVVTFLYRAYN